MISTTFPSLEEPGRPEFVTERNVAQDFAACELLAKYEGWRLGMMGHSKSPFTARFDPQGEIPLLAKAKVRNTYASQWDDTGHQMRNTLNVVRAGVRMRARPALLITFKDGSYLFIFSDLVLRPSEIIPGKQVYWGFFPEWRRGWRSVKNDRDGGDNWQPGFALKLRRNGPGNMAHNGWWQRYPSITTDAVIEAAKRYAG